ncbi:MAG: DUF2125 domain-containing protein [Pseudomonadota bacterium]
MTSTRLIIIAVFAAFALWAGYWFFGQSQQQTSAANWFESQQDAGWVAEYDSLDVQGFPNRFDTVIRDITLADPKTGWAWSAQSFEILSLSYRPNHVIFVFPKTHLLRTPHQNIQIANTDLRGSAVFEPGTDYDLNRSSFEGADLVFDAEKQDPLRISSAQLATRKSPTDASAHDIALTLKEVDLGDDVLALLKGSRGLPSQVEEIRLRATADFSGPWDLPSLSGSGPDLRSLDLDDLSFIWDDLRLRAAGDLSVDALGYPEGSLDLRAEGWEKMVDIAVANSWVPRELEDSIIAALQFLARLKGTAQDLEISLRFADRTTYLGPIPLGPAPVIWAVQRQ